MDTPSIHEGADYIHAAGCEVIHYWACPQCDVIGAQCDGCLGLGELEVTGCDCDGCEEMRETMEKEHRAARAEIAREAAASRAFDEHKAWLKGELQ